MKCKVSIEWDVYFNKDEVLSPRTVQIKADIQTTLSNPKVTTPTQLEENPPKPSCSSQHHPR